VWHTHGAASRQGYGGNHSIDGLVARNRFNDTVLADHQQHARATTQGVLVSRVNSVLKNFDSQGFSVGIQTQQFSAFQNVGKLLMIEDGVLANFLNVRAADVTLDDREQVIIKDVVFGAIPNYPLTAFTWQEEVAARFEHADMNHYDLVSGRSQFYIHNYNRGPGDDFQLFRETQNPFYSYM
jgi:hypothetical protein